MSQIRISDLPVGSALTGTEQFPAVQGGVTVCSTPAAVKSYIYPVQTGNAGKVLGTDGTNTSWVAQTPPQVPPTRAQIAAVLYPAIPAESGVTIVDGGYPPYDIRRYGGDPTGATACDTAMASVLTVCGTAGGTIRFPAGTYKFNSTINLNGMTTVTLQGDGAASVSGTPATVLSYTSTGTAAFITAGSSNGIGLRNLYIQPTSAYSGILITLGHAPTSDAAFFSMVDCTIGAASNTSASYLSLDKSINCYFLRVNFVGGGAQVKGQLSTGGSYSNAITFLDCQFGGSTQDPIVWPGDTWNIQGCTFEGVLSGGVTIAGAVQAISTTPIRGFVFQGNWCGDVTGGSGTWLYLWGDNASLKGGAVISGNFFGGSSGSLVASLNSLNGVQITGNYFDSFLTAISFDTATNAGAVVSGNSFIGVTNAVAGSAIPLDLVFNPNSPRVVPASGYGLIASANPGYEFSPNGILRQWGETTVTTPGSTTVTFPRPFPSACWNLVVSLYSPSAGTDTVYATGLTITGFTASTAGAAGGSNVFWQAVGN